jgi:ribose transport system substrate-binding protein
MKYKFLLFRAFTFLSILLISTAVDNAQEKEKGITIGLIGKSQSNPVFIAAYAGARVAANELSKKYNIEINIDWQTPENESPQEQAQAIEKFIKSGASGIAIACSDENILTPFIDKASENGIPVLCFDSDASKSKRFVYYGSDDYELGRMIMKELAMEMNEKGIVAILGGNKNAPNLKKRVQAVIEELKNYPSMKLAENGVCYHEETPEQAAKTVSRFQKANPQVRGWAFIGGWPLWVKDAIKWKPEQIKIVAADALPAELEYLKSRHVQVLIAQNCFLWGYHSVELLLNKITTNINLTKRNINGELTRVSKENLEEWSLNWKKWLLKEAVNR